MLEEMGEFFDSRLCGYEKHQLTCIDCAQEFYPFTAGCLPQVPDTRLLDLGCGTGLELGFYFELVPSAEITGIDLAPGMLDELHNKFPDKKMTLVLGSYFDVLFDENAYDAAVSVESLHHFTAEQKESLYTRLHAALKENGCFVLTDYFAESEEQEKELFRNLKQLKQEQGLPDDVFFHYDTPLTVEHETEALLAAGFSSVERLAGWGATHTLRAAL